MLIALAPTFALVSGVHPAGHRVDALAASHELADAEAAERRLLLLALEAEARQRYALRDTGTISDETPRGIESLYAPPGSPI